MAEPPKSSPTNSNVNTINNSSSSNEDNTNTCPVVLRISPLEFVHPLNTRSDQGRVVINNPGRTQLKVHKPLDQEKIHFCCGRFFLTLEAFEKHNKDTEDQGEEHFVKKVDPTKIRMALHLEDSVGFWGARKVGSAKRFDDEGNEVVEEEEDEDNEDYWEEEEGEGDDDEMPVMKVEAVYDDEDEEDGGQGEASGPDDGPPQLQPEVSPNHPLRKKMSSRDRRNKKKRGKLRCQDCNMDIPATNIRRHIRVCHNPEHEFPCRFCSCRFEQAYGKMVHEIKCHKVSPVSPTIRRLPFNKMGRKPPSTLTSNSTTTSRPTSSSTQQSLQYNSLFPPKPSAKSSASKSPSSASTEPSAVLQARNILPELTEEQMTNCSANIRKLGKDGNESKARYQCLICQKTFLGSRNAQDHMNSHYGLKPYRCPLCEYSFSFRSNVVRHVKTCHTENSDYICPYGCGCSMQSETSLKVHVKLICNLRHQYQGTSTTTGSSSTPPTRNRVVIKKQNPTTTSTTTNTTKRVASGSTSGRTSNTSAGAYYSPSLYQNNNDPRPSPGVLKNKFQHLEVSPGIYRCDKCNKTITGSGNFRDHLNIHFNIRPHKCPKCYMRFTFKSNIKRHLSSAHVPNGRFKCPMRCGCVMDNQHALQSHLNKCKVEIVKYRKAQKQEQQQAYRARIKQEPVSPTKKVVTPAPRPSPGPPPLRKILPRPPPLIPAPGFALAHQGQQPYHQQMRKQPQLQDFSGGGVSGAGGDGLKHECNVCGKVVSCRRNLNNHMLIHQNIKPCKCLICGLHFRTLDTLKKHKQRSHGINSPFKCTLCTCRFTHQQGLTMHQQIHHRNRNNFAAEVKQEVDEEDEEEEMMEGQGQDQGQDDDSDNPTTPKLDLNKTRTRDGNWKCPTCGKILKKGLHLQNHMRIHSGEKPYKCHLCGHRFRLASTLYDHKKSSHRGGKYKCDLCTCTFETNLGLSRHKGIFHNNNPGEEPSYMAPPPPQTPHSYIQRKVQVIKQRAMQSQIYQGQGPSRLGTQGHHQNQIVKQSSSTTPSSRSNGPDDPTSSSASFECGECGLMLPSLIDLSDHQERVHQGGGMMDTNDSIIDIHDSQDIDSSTNIRPDLHDYPKPKLIDLNDPKPAPRECHLCGLSIHGKVHYNKHMSGCHSGGPYKCRLCPCSFEAQGGLSRHITLMHPGGQGQGSFTRGGPTTMPVLEYQDDNDDDQGYGTYEGYPEPEVSMEEGEDGPQDSLDAIEVPEPVQTRHGKRYLCNECGKSFDKLTRYRLHATVHSNIKPYNCTKCGQKFRLPGILATHMKKSHGNGQFHCTKCPSRFTSYKGLTVHEFVFHKGGRQEREENKTNGGNPCHAKQETSKTMNSRIVQRPPVPVTQQNHSQGTMINKMMPKITKISSNTSNTSIRNFQQPRTQVPQMSLMSPPPDGSPREVKLRCHICGEILLGTSKLRDHLKEHTSKQGSSSSSTFSRQPQSHQRPSTSTSFLSPTRTLHPQQSSSSFNSQPKYSVEISPVVYEDEEEDGEEEGGVTEGEDTFQIIGYENGFVNNNHHHHQEDQDEDEETEIIDYNFEGEEMDTSTDPVDPSSSSYEYDYMNADDHLEIVHEENNFGYEDDDNNNEDTTIPCKACGQSFESRDAFAFHIESQESDESVRCPYCCTPNLSVSTLPPHIERIHPIDEVEFMESHVYSDA